MDQSFTTMLYNNFHTVTTNFQKGKKISQDMYVAHVEDINMHLYNYALRVYA